MNNIIVSRRRRIVLEKELHFEMEVGSLSTSYGYNVQQGYGKINNNSFALGKLASMNTIGAGVIVFVLRPTDLFWDTYGSTITVNVDGKIETFIPTAATSLGFGSSLIAPYINANLGNTLSVSIKLNND